MVTVIINTQDQQFEVRMGLKARPKDGKGPDVQVLSFNERDAEVNIEEVYSPDMPDFPRKTKISVAAFSKLYQPFAYAF